MAHIQTALTGSCGLGLMYGFGFHNIPTIPADKWNKPTSKHFIATFCSNQKLAFDEVCKKHTPVFTHLIDGSHGKYKVAFVLFKWGKS